MQADIIELIDTLVRMTGSTTNVETLQNELDEIKKLITNKEIDLQDLKESMVDDKYYDASGEVVDRNIEISLTKKIKRLKKMADEIKEELETAKNDELALHDEVKKLKEELDASSKYIEVIEERIHTTNSAEIKENYQELLTIERNNYATIEVKLSEKLAEYSRVQKEIECLAVALSEMEENIAKETDKLEETKKNLANPKTYSDEALRKADEEKLSKLIEEIDELDKRRLNILTDPVMIANDVKELVANDDKSNSLLKLKELITLVKSIPYMDESDVGKLNGKLASLEKELKELTKAVENKKYNGQDNSLIEERINYLKNIIELAKINIDQIRENITIIDTQRVAFIKNKITNAEDAAREIEKSIAEYHALMNNDDKKSEKVSSSLKAAYNKKVKELENVHNIVNAYKDDLRALIKEAFDAENVEITEITKTIKLHEAEITKLTKLMVLNSKTKDVIAEEKDKAKIKELNDEIKNINFRLTFDKSPDEIYDDIEMILGSIGFVENKSRNLRSERFTFEKIEEPKEIIKEEPILETTKAVDTPQEVLPDFVAPNENNQSTRLKVVEIIPLDSNGEQPKEKEQDDYMINDFEDNDYMKFEDAIAKANNGGETSWD